MQRFSAFVILLAVMATALPWAEAEDGFDSFAQGLRLRLLQAGSTEAHSLIAPVSDAAVVAKAAERITAVGAALRDGDWDLALLGGRADGECGAVVVAFTAGKSQPPTRFATLYLLSGDGTWRLLPNASEYARVYHRLTAEQRAGFARLAAWARSITPAAPARWTRGSGSIAGKSASEGAEIDFLQPVEAVGRPVELVLPGLNDSALLLATGTIIRLDEQLVGGERQLIVLLDQGTLQLDVRGLGPYAKMRVRGATMDVEVLGTLFVVQRLHRDDDYVALIRGKVSVQGSDGRQTLGARQGVGNSGGHLRAIDRLINRPQLTNSAAEISLRDQGLADAASYSTMVGGGIQGGDASWAYDAAAASIGVGGSVGSQVSGAVAQTVADTVANNAANQAAAVQAVLDTQTTVLPLGNHPILP